MYSVRFVDKREVNARAGEVLLDSFYRSGVTFNHNCRMGRCAACKCKVLEGMTAVVREEVGLTSQEKKEGYILSCVRTVESDLLIDVENRISIELPPVKMLPIRISEINMLSEDVVQILLRLPPNEEFLFLPGQHIDVKGPSGVRRSYSLASESLPGKLLELHIRAIKGGVMSRYWFHQASVDDLLYINGPHGTFFLGDIKNKDLVFLATGTGIAPVKSMLDSLAHSSEYQEARSITVIWGGRDDKDIYLNMMEADGKYDFIPVHSCPDESWQGKRGYVQDVLLGLNFDFNKLVVYACGSDRMINCAQSKLVEAGLSPQDFYSDSFVASGSS